jgi:hypothetical protein
MMLKTMEFLSHDDMDISSDNSDEPLAVIIFMFSIRSEFHLRKTCLHICTPSCVRMLHPARGNDLLYEC